MTQWSPGDPWGDARAGRARETQGAATGVRLDRPDKRPRPGVTGPQAGLLKRLADAGNDGLYLRGSDIRVYGRLLERGLVRRRIEGWGSLSKHGRALMEEAGW